MSNDNTNAIAWIMAIVLIVLILAAKIAWSVHVYGDWTCAFSHCIRVQDVTP